ncbi:hypothetical protein ACCS70_25830 [Rhizobium ruizarguesonis]|uniref:Uncharacterized protein n=1 Tax=Rhizobium ruizarguesonis TaxID=2081791 RepID=A0AAE4YU02_9HYPH|nr:hypothetical protein [Rhizobium ruizarguesonis]NEI05465.1 hypothetical protein [Rhizobium ruizarguesonis]NEI51115.1 hypothetical protein [Rhizobium ruizarguesonis]NEJ01947.1 hypothetical protein [Rhizobium ruizarguesonis]NEJ39058.1 hypothetical protein [Rhizobium ruizarguesonis]NEJ88514.1 hypothetical protein [Rhizobium ruizarguesonis]
MAGRDGEPVVAVVSEAVRRWYEFYEITPDNKASDVLCHAALNFYGDGYRTIDDIATLLIGTYPGLSATRINAPTSQAVH